MCKCSKPHNCTIVCFQLEQYSQTYPCHICKSKSKGVCLQSRYPRSFSGLYINHPQVLELPLSQSHISGENAAQFSAIAIIHIVTFLQQNLDKTYFHSFTVLKCLLKKCTLHRRYIRHDTYSLTKYFTCNCAICKLSRLYFYNKYVL